MHLQQIESIALLKIWCLQRGFLRGHDTLTETTLCLLFSYLFRSKIITLRMESIQIFMVMINFLAETEWLGWKYFESKTPVNENNCYAHSHYCLPVNFSVIDIKKKVAIVMPEIGMSEKLTVSNCVHNILFVSKCKGDVTTIKTKIVGTNDNIKQAETLLDCYKINTDGPVFLDPTMTVNYFGNISSSFMKELQIEAHRSLSLIHGYCSDTHSSKTVSGMSAFRFLFLEHIRFWRRYDAYVKINIDEILLKDNEYIGYDNLCWSKNINDIGEFEAVSRGLVNLLGAALGDRITAIRSLSTGNGEIDFLTENFGEKNVANDNELMTWVDSDDNVAIPIRGSNNSESAFVGYGTNNMSAPIKQSSQIVIGIRINEDTCHRIVDRGPPVEDPEGVNFFLKFWGRKKAQLRRFKDGAIVHAVIWDGSDDNDSNLFIKYSGYEKCGGITEQIIHHIIMLHFFDKSKCMHSRHFSFIFRDMVSLIDGNSFSSGNRLLIDSTALYKDIMSAFESLSRFLKENSTREYNKSGVHSSKLGLPLSIDTVEAVSPYLRYADLFPPVPHPLLGGNFNEEFFFPGVVVGDPIYVQIRFEHNSKWPFDVDAIGTAKCAMLIQIAEGIKKMKLNKQNNVLSFKGPIHVMPSYMDIGFRGYVWRIFIAADQELKVIESLHNPSFQATSLRKLLIKRHFISVVHHFVIHSLHTKHPSSSGVLRLAKRWMASHMLSGLFRHEAIELLILYIYTNPQPLLSPTTVISGFMRFLHLMAFFDWVHEPLIIDPNNDIKLDERFAIHGRFQAVRGSLYLNGPPMYIVSPNHWKVERLSSEDGQLIDSLLTPIFTCNLPEKVVLSRTCSLAKRSYHFLLDQMIAYENSSSNRNTWISVFQENSASLKSYNSLIRINSDFVIDSTCSSTVIERGVSNILNENKTLYTLSLERRYFGPRKLHKNIYKNLSFANGEEALIYCWRPIEAAIARLRYHFGHLIVFFYNEYTPNAIAMLWRPHAFTPRPFSAINSEYKIPDEPTCHIDTHVAINSGDVFSSLLLLLRDLVVDLKVFNY